MSGRLARLALAVPFAGAAGRELAHHGAAAVSAIGAEGPGAALDTTSPLPLGQGTALARAKRLDEADRQQGSEGLESHRAALTLGYSTRP